MVRLAVDHVIAVPVSSTRARSQSTVRPEGNMLSDTLSHDSISPAPIPFYDYLSDILVLKRILWLICATMSLLSARHLLVERNFHYPLQLYFIQLAVASLFAIPSCWTRQAIRQPFRESLEAPRFLTLETGLHLISTCIVSLSTICVLQAILHFQNLPTLIMMTVRLHRSIVTE